MKVEDKPGLKPGVTLMSNHKNFYSEFQRMRVAVTYSKVTDPLTGVVSNFRNKGITYRIAP